MKIKDNMRIIGTVLGEIRNAKTGKLGVQETHNLVTDAGKTAIASGIRGLTTSNAGIITYCAVGTDATAPVAANTTLGSELDRKLVSVRGNTAD